MRGKRVMEQMIGGPIVGVGRARNHDHRQIFGIGAGDGVDRRKAADAEGDDGRRRPAGAGVTLRGLTAVEFIAAVNLLKPPIRQELVEKHEVEISRDHEMVLQANLSQTRCEVTADIIHFSSLASRASTGLTLYDYQTAFAKD